MPYVGLVTLIIIVQYIAFMLLVGKQRVAHQIKAPATSGHELFDRAYRIQMNTLEQMAISLPAMWVCAWFFSPAVAAALGLLFAVGRFMYGLAYMANPEKRGPGMGIGFLACVGMIGCGLWGIVAQLANG
jgi:glutathione S-transferase